MFNIEIKIPNIIEKERHIIHVDMTTNMVDIDVKNPPNIIFSCKQYFKKRVKVLLLLFIDPKNQATKRCFCRFWRCHIDGHDYSRGR